MFFETENVSTWGGLEHPTFGFMPNALTNWAIRARHLLSHVFEYWFWWCRYFWSKVNIWNVDRARETTFIFDTQALIWNLKVKFMGVVIGQGNTMSPVSNWFTFFCLHQFGKQFMIYNYLKSDFEKINVILLLLLLLLLSLSLSLLLSLSKLLLLSLLLLLLLFLLLLLLLLSLLLSSSLLHYYH